nr:retinoic acid receptor responder protein 1 isoform X2 [Gorilla gorilla gorilla]
MKHPGTKPGQRGGAERTQGLRETWKRSGPMGTQARYRPSPRGRRGGAHHGLISASAGTARSEPVSVGCRANFPASMQPRRQRLPAPWSGPRGPRPTAPLLALLLLLAPVVAPAGSGGPDDPGQPQDAGVPRRLLQQAARAALHFFNFRSGSPSALRVLAEVQEGSAWINPKEGCKVHVVFSTERYNPESLLQEGEGRLGKCSARVFFKNQKPRPTINVTCTRLIEKKKRQQEDYLLYKQMKQLKNPLETVSIPDNHGHIDPSLRPIWDLAFLGSSYVMWEMTTQVSHYYLAQLTSVRQWVHPWMDHQKLMMIQLILIILFYFMNYQHRK